MERGTNLDLLKAKDNIINHLRQTLLNRSVGDNMQLSRSERLWYQTAVSERDKKIYSLRLLLDNHLPNQQRTIRALEDKWKKEREGLEQGRRDVIEWGLSTFKQKDDLILSLRLKVESLEEKASTEKKRVERSEMESRMRDTEVREMFRVKEKEKHINYLLRAMERYKTKQEKLAEAHTGLQNLCAFQEKNWREEREEMERRAREADQSKMEEKNEKTTLQQTVESLQAQLDDMSKAHKDLQSLSAAQQEEWRKEIEEFECRKAENKGMAEGKQEREIGTLCQTLYSAHLEMDEMATVNGRHQVLLEKWRKERREMEGRMNKAVEKYLTKEKELEILEREREELLQLLKLKDCEGENEREQMREQLDKMATDLEKAEKKIHSKRGFLKFFKRQDNKRANIPDGKKMNDRKEREEKKESC